MNLKKKKVNSIGCNAKIYINTICIFQWRRWLYVSTVICDGGILLTCEKHLHNRIISKRGEGFGHKTSLTPPIFIELPVPSQESERSRNFITCGDNLSYNSIFIYIYTPRGEGWIPITGLISQHWCACLKPWSGFSIFRGFPFSFLCSLRGYCSFCWIFLQHILNFLFIIYSLLCLTIMHHPWTMDMVPVDIARILI